MEVGKETTDIAAQLTAEALREAIKLTGMLTGKTAQFALETVIEKYKQRRDILKPGDTNLEKLLRSQKALKMVDMDKDDLQVFSERATRFGLTFAVVAEDKSNHIIFKEEDTPFMQKVLEITLEKKLEKQREIENDAKLEQYIETLKAKSEQEKNIDGNQAIDSSVEDPASRTMVNKKDPVNSKETENSRDQSTKQQEVINKKLATEQFAADKKDIDIPNNEITVKSHLEKNKANKKKKDLSENKDNRISIRQELAKTSVPAEPKKSKAPTKIKSAKENVRG